MKLLFLPSDRESKLDLIEPLIPPQRLDCDPESSSFQGLHEASLFLISVEHGSLQSGSCCMLTPLWGSDYGYQTHHA